MAQPWLKYQGQTAQQAPAQTQPAEDPIIRPRDPYKDRDQALQEAAAARAAAAAERAANADQRSAAAAERAAAKDAQGTVDEKKIATLLTRIAGGFNDITNVTRTDPSAQEPGLVESMRGDLMPGGIMGVPARAIAGSNRRTVHDSQRDVLDALLTLGTGAAYSAEQLSGQMASYFPQYGDTKEEIAVKNQRMQRIIEAAKANAGPAWAQVEPAIAPYMKGMENPVFADPNVATVRDGRAFDDNGNDLGAVTGGNDPNGGGGGPNIPISQDLRDRAMRAEQMATGDQSGLQGLSTLAQQGITLGLADEAAGVGGFLSSLIQGEDPRAGYVTARDARRASVDRAKQSWGLAGTAAEFLGGGGAVRLASAPNSLLQAARQGAGVGAVAGYGSGEGGAGSAANALAGAAIGGGLGAGFQGVGNALARRSVANAPDMAVVEAGQRQGIPVRQPDARPDLRGKYATMESTQFGGPRIADARSADAAAIEQRAAEVTGGTAFNSADNTAMGQSVQRVAERGQDNIKAAASALYTRVEQRAGGFSTPANRTAQFIDSKIAELKAASPSGYNAEISALEGMKADLAQTGLSVRTLQAQRETVGGRIGDNIQDRSRADKTFTEVLQVASDELHSALRQTDPQAAAMLSRADAKWGQYKRLQQEVTGLFLGKRGNATAEMAARNLNATTRNNYSALRRFMAMATPEEKADFATTFVREWGSNQRGEFSPAIFAKNMENVSDRTLQAIVGTEGRAALRDLQVLSNAKTDAMARQAPSGKAVSGAVNGLKNLFLAGLGLSTGGLGTAVAAGTARPLIAALGEQRAARLLLNPDFTKWLRNIPNTTNPQAIDRYIAKLASIRTIAANDNQAFTNAVMQAFRSSPGTVAASSQQENETRRIPPQQ